LDRIGVSFGIAGLEVAPQPFSYVHVDLKYLPSLQKQPAMSSSRSDGHCRRFWRLSLFLHRLWANDRPLTGG
jgi:hypothetical protein